MMVKKCLTGLCIIVLIVAAAVSANAQLIDNGNGTVTDNVTGLMWQQATAPGTYTWAQALSYCENLTWLSNSGYSDWRLPTRKELRSIVDYGRWNPAINTDYFPDTLASFYWSSTTFAGGTDVAWDVLFSYGYANIHHKYNYGYVRAVRGGQSGPFGPLVIAQTPMAGPPGTTFTQWGTGFSPNSTATLHFQKPDGTQYPTMQQPIDATGHFEITYTSAYDKAIGNYTWWAVDGPSGQSSNAVTYAIEGEPGKLHHFEFSDIGSQTAGAWFSERVTIEAVDYNGDRVTSFSGEVSLSHNGPGQISSTSQVLINGYVNFPLKLSQANTNCVLSCRGSGVNGYSNTFAVTGGSSAMGSISGSVKNSDKTIEVILSSTPFGAEIIRVTATSDGYLIVYIPAGLYYLRAVDSEQRSSLPQAIEIEAGQTTKAPDLIIRSKKRPVIFVPGIMGSDKKWALPSRYPTLPAKMPADQDDLQIHDPGSIIKGYAGAVGWEKLYDKLKDNYEIIECPYDWRVDLNRSKDSYKKYLMEKIKQAKEKTGWEKVDIVAHSMGGLLVRSYIQSEDYAHDIDKFAMVGTPNKGSLNVYYIWEGGDPMVADDRAGGTLGPAPYFYSNVAQNLYSEMHGKKMFSFLLDVPLGMLISNKKAKAFFEEDCPSMLQLMPTFNDCLIENGNPKSIEEEPNDWLINLNKDSSVKRIERDGEVKTRIFASKDMKTQSKIYVRDCPIDGLYEDGMEEKIPETDDADYGDGTVLYESAKLTENMDIEETHSYGEHASLIKESAQDVTDFLNEGRTFAASKMVPMAAEAEPIYTSSLGVSVTGPPSVLLTDPSDLKCGIDQTTGEIFEEIAGSKTLGQSGDAMATIPDPVNGAFTVKLSGSETGTASISISYMTETDSEEQQFALYFSGEPITFTFTLDSGGSPRIQVSDIPIAPIGLSGAAFPSGETQLTRLNWQASVDPTITGYRIYARNENDSDFTLLAEVPAGQTQYDTSDPWDDPARTYAVSAVDSDGHEGFLSDFAENTTYLLADFGTGAVTGETPFVVSFTDASTGTPTSWQWDFGDGETSTEQNPSHTYNEPGNYTVSLTVTDAEDNQDIEIKSDLLTVAQGDFIVTSIGDSTFGADPIPGTLRYALEQAAANGSEETDTIRFAAGLEGMTIQLLGWMDIPGNLIIDGTGGPAIDGSLLFIPGPGLWIGGVAGVEISGLTFSDFSPFSSPVYITGGTSLKLTRNTVINGFFYIALSGTGSSVRGMEITANDFSGEQPGGVLIDPGREGQIEDVSISDNTLTQNNYIGLYIFAGENRYNNCRISDVMIRNNYIQNGIFVNIGSGYNNHFNGIVMENNLIEYSTGNFDGFGIALNNHADGSSNSIDVIVRRNMVSGMKRTGIGIFGNVIASVTNNVFSGNSFGMMLSRGCTVHGANNLVVKNIHGIEIGQDTNTALVNNIIIENCISGATSLYGLPLSGIVLAYNNVWDNGTNYIGLSPGESDISTDPKFINADAGDYHLAADSPCIDTGSPDIAYNDGPAGQGEARSDIGLYGGSDSNEFADGTPAANYIEGGTPEYYLASIKVSENIKQVFSGEFDPDTQYRVRADAASYSCETSAGVITPLGTHIPLTDDGSNDGDRYPYDLVYGGAVQYSGPPELGDWHFEVTSGGQPYTGTVTLGENTLEPPKFLQPIDGAVNTGTTPEIIWQMPESSALPEGFEVSIFKGKPEQFNPKYAIFYTYINDLGADRFQVPAGLLEFRTIYYVVVSARIEENNVYSLASEIVRFNTTLTGDLNIDDDVDLEDAIHALKAMTGMDTADAHGEAEISGDGKVGIEEVVYILQKAAGLR